MPENYNEIINQIESDYNKVQGMLCFQICIRKKCALCVWSLCQLSFENIELSKVSMTSNISSAIQVFCCYSINCWMFQYSSLIISAAASNNKYNVVENKLILC